MRRFVRVFAHEHHSVHGVRSYMRLVAYCSNPECQGTVIDSFGPTPACTCASSETKPMVIQSFKEAAE